MRGLEKLLTYLLNRLIDVAVEKTLDTLAPIHDLRRDVDELKLEVKRIWEAIRDADKKHTEDQKQMQWVKDFMDIAYQIEDVVDSFFLESPQYDGSAIDRLKGITFIKELNKKIDEIKDRIKEINKYRETLVEDIGEPSRQPRDFWQRNSQNMYDRHDDGSESYYRLPFHMKLCFLYFAAFPQNFEIETRALLRIWIAERLIPHEEGRTLEETAESFLDDLVLSNMVIVSQKFPDGSIKSCRINKELKSLAIQKSKEINFLVVCSKPDDWDSCKEAPRVAVHHTDDNVPMNNYASPNARALLFFSKSSKIDCSIYRNLRVLANMRGEVELQRCTESPYLRGSPHLRYLQLNTVFKEKDFGKWISGMKNLETLDLRLSMHDDLSNWLWNIDTLRHVLLSEYYGETKGPPTSVDERYVPRFIDLFRSKLREKLQSANNLRTPTGLFWSKYLWEELQLAYPQITPKYNLQTITGVSWNNSWEKLGPPNMLEVRELGIRIDRNTERVNATIASLLVDKLKHLDYLKIQGAVDSQIIRMNEFPFYENLKSLILINDDYNSDYVLNLGDGMLPPNLTELELGFEFGSDPMPVLEKLRRLNTLRIRGPRDIRNNPLTTIRCSAGGFKLLEELVLESLRLKEWKIEMDAMPWLERLNIRLCPLLKVPLELIHLRYLRHLTCTVIKTSLYFANRDDIRNIFELQPRLQGGLLEEFEDFIPFDSF